ncbi:phage tail terminator protein [Enterobacter intestinihominis]
MEVFLEAQVPDSELDDCMETRVKKTKKKTYYEY